MTYSVLVRGCVQGGLIDKAVELVKSAHGHGPAPSRGTPPGLTAGCFDEVVAALGGAATDEAKELISELGDRAPALTGKALPSMGKQNGKGYGKGAGRRPPTSTTGASWRQQ